jgi:predicted kinase
MVGIPAAGKSTVRDKEFSGATIICPDDMIGYTKDSPWTPQAAKGAWKTADRLLSEAIARGDETIVFDATMVSPKRRGKYIRIAKAAGMVVKAAYCRVDLNIALERNASRDSSRQVPEFVVRRMLGDLQPPEKEEGFDDILTFG